SPANFREFATRSTAFEGVSAYTPQFANLTGRGAPLRLEGYLASGNLFTVLGRRPALGTVFTPADEAATDTPVVVLSHRAWTTYFGGDPGIIGQVLTLNSFPHTVIG